MPGTSRSRSGWRSITSNTWSPNAATSFLAIAAADALDHAGAEVGLDALERARRHRRLRLWARNCRPKLGLVCQLPSARTTSPGATCGALADHGRRLALLGELDPEHAKAGLGIVEHHPLDQAGQGLRRGLRGGQRERSGVGRLAALTARFHGAPNLTVPRRFDKRAVRVRPAAAAMPSSAVCPSPVPHGNMARRRRSGLR